MVTAAEKTEIAKMLRLLGYNENGIADVWFQPHLLPTIDQIDRAFRHRALQVHPDKGGVGLCKSRHQALQEQMTELNKAHDFLKEDEGPYKKYLATSRRSNSTEPAGSPRGNTTRAAGSPRGNPVSGVMEIVTTLWPAMTTLRPAMTILWPIVDKLSTVIEKFVGDAFPLWVHKGLSVVIIYFFGCQLVSAMFHYLWPLLLGLLIARGVLGELSQSVFAAVIVIWISSYYY